MISTTRLITLTVLVLATNAMARNPYYYSGGGQIPLGIDSTRITVKFDPGITPTQQTDLVETP